MKLTGNNLIIVNTLATYVRILLVAGLMLFSTRWVLQALGKEDFGLYTVVGGLIVFVTFVRTVTAGSSQRFFAYAIGQGNSEEVKRWFNLSFSLHLVFALFIIGVGVPLGNFFIDHVLHISPDRLDASRIVYYLSLLGAVFTAVTTPGYAILIAKQRIFEIALWETLRGFLFFGVAFYLLRTSGDLLVKFALGMVACAALINVIQYARARMLFPECSLNLKYWIDREKLRKLLGYSWWFTFAALCSMARSQGVAVFINIFNGVAANAAYGIANQVSGQASTISTALYGAIAPEMASSEGRGDRNRVVMLSLRASKFVSILTLFWLIPLFAELDYILKLWLINVPEHTATFCRIILIAELLNKMTLGQMGAMHATGRIAEFEGTMGILYLLALPLVGGALWFGLIPEIALVGLIIIGILVAAGRLYWIRKLMNVSFSQWLKEVFLKSLLIAIPSILIALLLQDGFEPSFFRLCLLSGATTTGTLAACYLYGLNEKELAFIDGKLKAIKLRFIK